MALRPRPHLRSLHRLRNSAERQGKLRLDKNEHTTGLTCDVVRAALARVTPDGLATYPELEPLYDKLATVLGLSPDELLLTCGSDAAIKATYEVFVAPGDRVILLRPTYAMFHVYAEMFGAVPIDVSYRADLTLDAAGIPDLITPRVSLVALANPNSPTGTVIAEADLLAVVERAAACDVVVLIDEAYFPFHPGTLLPYIRRYENLVVTRSLSKAFGLGALRVGLAAAGAGLIELLAKVRPLYEVDGVAAAIAAEVLDHPDLVDRYVGEVREGGAYLARELPRLGLPTISGAANFLLVRVESEARGTRLRSALAQRGILIGGSLAPPLDGYLRITVGPVHQMQTLVETIRVILDGGL